MFEKFGEFDSAEELNLAAAGQKEEGDIESLIELAKENGIDEEVAKAYASGEINQLTDELGAALGKIELEKETRIECGFNFNDIREDIISFIMTECMENKVFAQRVRMKGKNLKGCLEYTAKKIKEKLNSKNGGLREKTVYQFTKDYFMK